VVRDIGTSMGITAAASIVVGVELVDGVRPEAGYTRALAFGAVAAAAIALLAVWLPGRAAPAPPYTRGHRAVGCE
jgi:hypothetical protein